MPKFAMHNDPKVRQGKYKEREGERMGGKNLLGMSDASAKYMYKKKDYANKSGSIDVDKIKAEHPETQGISIFDPVLTELVYTWFCPQGGSILDPFAGGSVRGIVASKLGRRYFGIELRGEQVAANVEQAEKICCNEKYPPKWAKGDSNKHLDNMEDERFDFVFSCPPYADLEVYSDDEADISNMPYSDFLVSYRSIIKKTCALLNEDAFACFVVGECRGKDGNYYNFVGDTITAFKDADVSYYNEAILITAIGSLPIRAGRIFNASRKLGKTHQNVLVFVKGDGKKAAEKCGEIDIDWGIGE